MAHEHRAEIHWERGNAKFTDGRFSRGHVWRFDGGIEVPASSAPSSVPLPLSVATAVDPEEAFVASLASCHMLFFIYFAWRGGFVVDRYDDDAVGIMTKNERGKLFVSKVTLNPAVVFSGDKRPSEQDVEALHHSAHEDCFIANSVTSEIVIGATKISFA
jgi:organic hydroperoxide reductase OsmC/OhrA